MTKCHQCGAEPKSDSVDTILLISLVVAVFSYGYLIRFNWVIMDILWDFGISNTQRILGPIFVLILWGSIAFFMLAIGIKWLER